MEPPNVTMSALVLKSTKERAGIRALFDGYLRGHVSPANDRQRRAARVAHHRSKRHEIHILDDHQRRRGVTSKEGRT